MNRRQMAMLLVALMLVPVAAGLLGFDHACTGQECRFCAAIRNGARLMPAAVLLGAAIFRACLFVCRGARRDAFVLDFTPVAARVRLND